MKLFLRILCITFLGCFSLSSSIAQTCPTGYTAASLNWDALEYIPTTGYSNAVATALSPKQNFAFGKNRLSITYNGVTSAGENATHTGSLGSLFSGEDVQYNGNGTITLTFATAVTNLKFSIFDVDKGQVIAFSALNDGLATGVTLTKAIPATPVNNNITIVGNTVTSNTGNENETDNSTTVNVNVVGPVTSITMSSSSTDTKNGGSADNKYWLSDIEACITNTGFPNSYYQVSRPYTGQPGYVLVAANKGVYILDPATGKAKLIFTDGATSGTINSLAYDPYNKVIYYTWSLTNNGAANASERTLRKYDFNTRTATVLLNDITSLGIPTFDQGVESGAAAFYDGALYLGIEGGAEKVGNSPKASTYKESIIWRLDFNNGVPATATQVYGVDGDKHDWGDFSINDGMIYDFNGDADYPDYHHYNMQSGANQLFTSSPAPKQSAVGWDGTVYWVSGTIAPYNLNGGIGGQKAVVGYPPIANWGGGSSPSFGDAAEAFRPQADFGDAPASYDPDPLAPALHEEDVNLKFGTKLGVEWNKSAITNTDDDDDGLYFVSILNQGGGVYQTTVKVFNNTGAPATVGGWMDFNGDNVFQDVEGVIITVGSSTVLQDVSLYWTGITQNMPNNSSTYLRIRVTSAINNMTKSSSTGYFANGEVEDWRVLVNATTLSANLRLFTAEKEGDAKANLSWNVTDETVNTFYELQRSNDGESWNAIYTRQGSGKAGNAAYSYTDKAPLQPKSYYRLKYSEVGKPEKYSSVQQVSFGVLNKVRLVPNPANDKTTLLVESFKEETGDLRLFDYNGRVVFSKQVMLKKGVNKLELPLWRIANGVYNLQIYFGGNIHFQKLVIQKQ